MVSIYQYRDFRAFVRDMFSKMPRKGYGQSLKLAKHLKVHTTLISQVLRGNKAFSLEQAYEVADYLGLGELETDYFVTLVQLEKAGTASLQAYFEKKLAGIKSKSTELVHRLKSDPGTSEKMRAVFYSHWKYSVARQLTAIPGHASLNAIAAKLDIPLKPAKELMDFLLQHGLVKVRGGKYEVGPSNTHLEAGSPWTYVNHLNWRQKAMEEYRKGHPVKLHYTAPMTLSKADAGKIRELLARLLETVDTIVAPSPSEELHCLNIDWFKL